MLRIIVIEDEQPAIDNLLYALGNSGFDYKLLQVLHSVEDSIQWFMNSRSIADLIFMDIQLADGLSFNIFRTVKILTPVIFTTAYDNYLLTSLEHNGIDYLLKPINQEKLNQSIIKFLNLKQHFTGLPGADNYQYGNQQNSMAKDRILVRKGVEFQSIKAEDVAYFYTDHKLVFVVDKEGKKFMAHTNNLGEITAQLNKKMFFRANRKYIININFIRKYRPVDRVKLEVELSIDPAETIVISQETSGSFKNWITSL